MSLSNMFPATHRANSSNNNNATSARGGAFNQTATNLQSMYRIPVLMQNQKKDKKDGAASQISTDLISKYLLVRTLS